MPEIITLLKLSSCFLYLDITPLPADQFTDIHEADDGHTATEISKQSENSSMETSPLLLQAPA